MRNSIIYLSSSDDYKEEKTSKNSKIECVDITKRYEINKKIKEMNGVFVLVGPVSKLEPLKNKLFELIGARGGGKPGRIQGTALYLHNIELVREVLISSSK